MIATTTMAVEVSISRSKSLASLLLRPSQAKVRSMTVPVHGFETLPCAYAAIGTGPI